MSEHILDFRSFLIQFPHWVCLKALGSEYSQWIQVMGRESSTLVRMAGAAREAGSGEYARIAWEAERKIMQRA